jgi:hypothetical protein
MYILPFPTFAVHIKRKRIMEIIVMKSGTCRKLIERLAAIEEYIRAEKPQILPTPVNDELWFDNEAVCAYLKVSRRTLQRYRSDGTLAYSMVGHKAYYKASEIKRLLDKRSVKRGNESPEFPSEALEISSKE